MQSWFSGSLKRTAIDARCGAHHALLQYRRAAHGRRGRVAFGNRALLDEVGEQVGGFGGIHGVARNMDVCRLCRRYCARAVGGWFEGIFLQAAEKAT